MCESRQKGDVSRETVEKTRLFLNKSLLDSALDNIARS